MNSYTLGIVVSIGTLFVVIELLRRHKLRERHAAWWLLAGAISLVLSIFPNLLVFLSNTFGIEIPSNLIFFLSIVILFFVCLQQSSELTKLEAKNRVLVEEIAFITERLDRIEQL